MYLSQNISYLLEIRRVKKTLLAEHLNIASTQISKYANGQTVPRIELLIQIAEYFDVNLDDLILKDLSQEAGRPFGAEGEDVASADATLVRMNELLEQRLRIVEQQLKKSDPGAADALGIK